MDKDATSWIEAVSNEGVTRRKVLEYVFVFDVIDLDDMVFKADQEIGVQREPQGRYYMRDVGFPDGLFPPQGE